MSRSKGRNVTKDPIHTDAEERIEGSPVHDETVVASEAQDLK